MANTPVAILDDTLTDIADAIRGKNGSSDTYKPSEMADAIDNIPSGGGGDNNWADVISGQTNDLYDNDLTGVRQYAFMVEENGIAYITSMSFPAVTTIGKRAFVCQEALTTVNFPSVETLNDYAFAGCSALTEVVLPSVHGGSTTTITNVFQGCTAVRKIDLGNNTTTMNKLGTSFFKNCSSLEALVLRSKSMVSISATSIFSGSGVAYGDAYIYVPSNLVNTYKNNSYWSNYSNQIRAIESYSTDGTVNGDIIVT